MVKYVQDATNILGDKLHQKMDSIAFTQVLVVLMMWQTLVMWCC